MTVNIFTYQAENLTEETFAEKGVEARDACLALLDHLGMNNKIVFWADPDNTFILIKGKDYIQVMLNEGEAKGDIVLHAEGPEGLPYEWQTKLYEPGPWLTRIRILQS